MYNNYFKQFLYKPTNQPYPNAQQLTQILSSFRPSFRNEIHQDSVSVLAIFFGQFLLGDLADLENECPVTPSQTFEFEIPGESQPNATFYLSKAKDMGIIQGIRQQKIVNFETSVLDASVIYGSSYHDAVALRSFVDGQLKTCTQSSTELAVSPFLHTGQSVAHKSTSLFDDANFFKLGHRSGNETPWLASLGIIWMRFHNSVARRIKSRNKHWSDEQIFQASKQYVTAVYQKIVVYEWLPDTFNVHLTPFDQVIEKNKEEMTRPTIYLETYLALKAAFYTMTPSKIKKCVFLEDGFLNVPRMCNVFWSMIYDMRTYGIDRLIIDMASQIAANFDHFVVEDFTEYHYGNLEMRPQINGLAEIFYLSREAGIGSFQEIYEELTYLEASRKLEINLLNQTRDFDLKENVDIFSNRNPFALRQRLREIYENDNDQIEFLIGILLNAGSEEPDKSTERDGKRGKSG